VDFIRSACSIPENWTAEGAIMRPEKWLNDRERLYVPDRKRCAYCGGSFGLIVHRSGQLKFCSLAHKTAHDQKEIYFEAAFNDQGIEDAIPTPRTR
jgi:hypothetical protein